ncbi:MAG: Methyltransferase [Candidatus Magasanikbacteria bacterium GW2011_GWC2_41_17]|uniref:Methyltransferase n=2 Tax=Candidatus Magasanikiibacteriota TaxID=1752731 RepID=A0A0G0YVG3_9BACT|nr:MAG: Methyltransferase [Candidatus Magasanikbacteria bacterium GW2011_GWC2_41_17]KKS13661.1 MAG: Methyltransferase [Candidatus Magasanikbacteria bacterium GW2011_GWA2_41_55]
MGMMKILLLQPLVPRHILWGKFEKGEGFVPPIGLLCLAAFLRDKGYDVLIKDAQVERLTEEDLVHYLRNGAFDVVGISTFTNSIAFSYYTAKIVKLALPGCQLVFGGVHATILPEQTLNDCPEADYIILGEGEFRMEKLLKYLEGKMIDLKEIDGVAYRRDGKNEVQPALGVIKDIDSLPLPAYDLVEMRKYVPHPSQYKTLPNYPLIIQRGCPYLCNFCSAHIVHGRNVRFKSVDKVMVELRLLKEKYGAKGVYFQDSTFLINKVYISELLNRMIKEKLNLVWACNTRVNTVDPEILSLMRRAGCWMIAYGIESGNQKSLNLMKKGVTVEQNEQAVKLTKKAGIAPVCCYILCLPGENYEDSLNTVKFALKLRSQMALFYLPVPYPGTELLELCRLEGGLQPNAKWEDYSALDFSNPVYVNPLIGKEKMQELLSLAYKKYYSNFVVILENVISVRSITDIKKYLTAFRAIFNF